MRRERELELVIQQLELYIKEIEERAKRVNAFHATRVDTLVELSMIESLSRMSMSVIDKFAKNED